MKTIREWLEELPEPYRTQAINNTVPSMQELRHAMYQTVCSALARAFTWHLSREGFDYWENVYNKMIDNESLDN